MNRLSAGIGVFVVNTICTLSCKKCITMTPYHDEAVNFPKKQVCSDLDAFFRYFKWVDHLDFEGGETLLHPQIADIIRYALGYKDHFDRIHILTNGTIVPTPDLLEACKGEKIVFLIDDYGSHLSVKKTQVCEILEQYDISYRIDTYCGDNQYYGGWVDLGDTQYKNYAKEELAKVYQNCRSGGGKYPYVKNGRMFVCEWQAAMMKHIPLIGSEFIDLRSQCDLESDMGIILRWAEHPVASCEYCKGFDVNSVRIPAAEQLTKKELADSAITAQVDYK